MKNSQRFVFTAILAAIALDVGSVTKLKNIWAMAFTGTTPNTPGGAPLSPADQQKLKQNAGGINPDANGKCPPGYTLMGGVCMPNSVLGQI